MDITSGKRIMIEQTYKDIVIPELLYGAIENNEFHGFLEDYRVLHSLLRLYEPSSVLEIGTNMGVGTNIICNAVPRSRVFSLDLPTELAHVSLQHPISEGKGDRVGERCMLPFTQLRGDSMKFDFSKYPCDAYYIDGEHTEEHAYHETVEVLKCNPDLIVYHDSNMAEVYRGIVRAFEGNSDYDLFRVIDTRIAYAKRK